ncbi:DUF5320 domain-containing protein [Candidatus Pacearchaeota archaeon]|nr:DUF5320 domain-containing protein [Candidatus Pacearchaeota archaeon]
MPQRDRTGPRGQGPKTGRGLGDCSGSVDKDADNTGVFEGFFPGRGFGRFCPRRNLGFGEGRGFAWQNVNLSKEQKKKILESQKQEIEKQLKEIGESEE